MHAKRRPEDTARHVEIGVNSLLLLLLLRLWSEVGNWS